MVLSNFKVNLRRSGDLFCFQLHWNNFTASQVANLVKTQIDLNSRKKCYNPRWYEDRVAQS